MVPNQVSVISAYLDALPTLTCPKQKDKSLTRSQEGVYILLSYGSEQKGYCLYNVQWLKIIHSRDVMFDVTSMGGTQLQMGPSPKYPSCSF